MPHPWPLFDLRLRTPHLELRLPTDDDLLDLMVLARHGIHDPGMTPFLFPWDGIAPKGVPVTEHLVRVTPGAWRRDLVPVTIDGLESCLDLFGVQATGTAGEAGET